jgi:flavin-dependent dehydrogenase
MHNERALLVGDAGGLCGAATGGGIFQAIASAQLAAEYVMEYLNGDDEALLAYRRRLHRFYNLRAYLFLERQVRRLLDELAFNGDLQWMFDRLQRPARQRLLRRGLLESHVSEMERVIWELLTSGLVDPLHSAETVMGALGLGMRSLTRRLRRAILTAG